MTILKTNHDYTSKPLTGFTNRSHEDIVKGILDVLANEKEVNKTTFIYTQHLSSTDLEIMLKFLVDNKLVSKTKIKERNRGQSIFRYTITNKGLKYLELMNRISALFTRNVSEESIQIAMRKRTIKD